MGFATFFPAANIVQPKPFRSYAPDTVLVIQWFVAGLIVPVSLWLVRAIRRRNQCFSWIKCDLLLVALALLSWRWFMLNRYSYPFPEVFG
ncbi:MAG: hypothetical protein LCH85_22560 [Chloroflexi bacterium]|nr:hypothetical protein [Chloroflexota bacterium]